MTSTFKEFKESISKVVKEKRPKLGDSSLKTYVSCLSNLSKNMNGEETIKWFDKDNEILEYLKDKPSSARKTLLSALFVLTENKNYRDIMIDDCKIVNTQYKEQKKTEKQKDGWVTVEEVKEKYDALFASAKLMIEKKRVVNYNTIMQCLTLGFLSGANGVPPRRNLDYCLMKIRNYDKKTDNYYEKGICYFNQYKTAKTYGTQQINIKEMSPEFNALLMKWVKINENDYMIYSSVEKPLQSPQVTKMLNVIFNGKKVAVDILRHVYLTNVYKDVPAITQMDSLASKMGHSTSEAMLYVKKS